jgi:SAM-dependent methyltransferase
VLDRKWLVTRLIRCDGCGLLYRAPTTSAAENARYYAREYSQEFTTTMPSSETLAALVGSGFAGSGKDYAPYLAVLDAAGAESGSRVVDFGCSWGYGSHQLARHGFSVVAYEVSASRRSFARSRLAVDVVDHPGALHGPIDVFFSAHVLEHVPSPRVVIEMAYQLLRPGGLFVAFTPNGSDAFRRRKPEAWHRLWGEVHPNFLDAEFYRRAFARSRTFLGSAPYDLDAVRRFGDGERCVTGDLSGDELVLVAEKGRAAPGW